MIIIIYTEVPIKIMYYTPENKRLANLEENPYPVKETNQLFGK